MRISALSALTAVLAFAVSASAQGLLIPTEVGLPPLSIRSHKVSVSLEAQTAVTTVEQVFDNHTDRQLEARFVFPIPRGAALTKFTMLVNGVEKSGELVEAKQARAIYNSIVQRSQDPGLLEYIGSDLLRANIFPILPHSHQKITVSFTRVADREGDLVHYVYPLKTAGKGAQVRGDFNLSVNVKSATAIKNVYSPSHSIVVARPDEKSAQVVFEQSAAKLDKDFHLYYGVSDKEIGLNLVTNRPSKTDPGHFLLLVSPRSKAQSERIVKRDVIFVMDTSGSMAGEKIKQAREALKFCVGTLNPGDRFDLIRFSTEVEPWKKELVAADDNARGSALKFIETLEAEGGTNVDGALAAALAYPRDASRPMVIMFFTDGKPTLGDTTDTKQILTNVKKSLANDTARGVRLFTWGVGYDLDTHLLDELANSAGGVSEYVGPQEDIAAKVAAFTNKAAHPVLTDLKLEPVGEKVALVDVYPKRLPDLYAGGQLVIFGRYTGAGAVALRLTGKINGVEQTFTYEADFAEQKAGSDFIEPLWAKRRIGHLLDTIRLHGETKELVDDVIRLSKQYGIQTPYTSYLILEDGMTVPADPNAPIALNRPAGPGPGRIGGAGGARGEADERRDAEKLNQRLLELAKPAATGAAPTSKSPAAEPADDEAKALRDEQRELAAGFKAKEGKAGVDFSKFVGDLKNADKAGKDYGGSLVRQAGDARLYRYRGLWVDERFGADTAVTAVKFGSDAYFALLDKKPELATVFKIGTELLVVTAPGKAVLVSANSGEEKLTDAQIAELFVAAAAAKK